MESLTVQEMDMDSELLPFHQKAVPSQPIYHQAFSH